MYSKNYRPTKAQKDFWNWIRETFTHCMFCPNRTEELHHVLGASAKEDHIHIGQWVLIPTCSRCNHNEQKCMPSKRDQVGVFVRDVLNEYWRRFGDVPMTKDELLAIATWSR